MKFDLHCHTRNGSPDARVDIVDYVKLLKLRGYDGMLVTDHDSYNGYRAWQKAKGKLPLYHDFIVLRGVEYDTRDAGHILVIMPQDVELKVLEVRGMRLETLIQTVHDFGGILGPAHPYGSKSSSLQHAKWMGKDESIMADFDFVEGFNTCETPDSNRKAQSLAARHHKICTGGSDAHKALYIGMAYTEFEGEIRNNDDLILAVKEKRILAYGGRERKERGKYMKLVPKSAAFTLYNQGLMVIHTRSGRNQLKALELYKTCLMRGEFAGQIKL